MFNANLRSCAAGVALLLGSPTGMLASHAQWFGVNLVSNGDAESGAGVSNESQTSIAVPQWLRPDLGLPSINALSAVQYGATSVSGAFPDGATPGPASRGNNFFSGGPASSASRGIQTLNIGGASASIDTGGVSYELSGYLGGYFDHRDRTTFQVSFRGGVGQELGSAVIGPVTVGDRGVVTSLLFRNAVGLVPAGTRALEFRMDMVREDGDYNDGYADNLSFVMTAVPEPQVAGVAAGLGAMAFAVFRTRGRRAPGPGR